MCELVYDAWRLCVPKKVVREYGDPDGVGPTDPP
jgi:hypothetical protein